MNYLELVQARQQKAINHYHELTKTMSHKQALNETAKAYEIGIRWLNILIQRGVYDELTHLLGADKAKEFINTYGGQVINFSKQQIIEMGEAQKLIKHFGKVDLYIPKPPKAEKYAMVKARFLELNQTMPKRHACNQIAKEFNYSYRWVVEIIKNN